MRGGRGWLWAGLLALGALGAQDHSPQPLLPEGYRLLYAQDFESPESLKDFEFTDPDRWRWVRKDGNGVLECLGRGKYEPKVRSPYIIGLLSHRRFGDFILEADLLQTGREYGHRDMCLFFGFQSPTRYYYAHLASKADPNAHNLFIVNDAPRRNFAQKTTSGVQWGEGVWHRVRLERRLADGSIRVFFDDMKEPIIVGQDKTFDWGLIGFGSFDDSGVVDNIKIWGPEVQEEKRTFFGRKE